MRKLVSCQNSTRQARRGTAALAVPGTRRPVRGLPSDHSPPGQQGRPRAPLPGPASAPLPLPGARSLSSVLTWQPQMLRRWGPAAWHRAHPPGSGQDPRGCSAPSAGLSWAVPQAPACGGHGLAPHVQLPEVCWEPRGGYLTSTTRRTALGRTRPWRTEGLAGPQLCKQLSSFHSGSTEGGGRPRLPRAAAPRPPGQPGQRGPFTHTVHIPDEVEDLTSYGTASRWRHTWPPGGDQAEGQAAVPHVVTLRYVIPGPVSGRSQAQAPTWARGPRTCAGEPPPPLSDFYPRVTASGGKSLNDRPLLLRHTLHSPTGAGPTCPWHISVCLWPGRGPAQSHLDTKAGHGRTPGQGLGPEPPFFSTRSWEILHLPMSTANVSLMDTRPSVLAAKPSATPGDGRRPGAGAVSASLP